MKVYEMIGQVSQIMHIKDKTYRVAIQLDHGATGFLVEGRPDIKEGEDVKILIEVGQ